MGRKIRILLIGSNGFIGSKFFELLKDKYIIEAPTIDKLDIIDEESVSKYLKKTKAEIIINLSGCPSIEYCETYHGTTNALNILAIRYLALNCKKQKKKLIQLSSSSALFDLCNYGKQKKIAEETIKDILDNFLILRCDKVYNENMPLVKIDAPKIALYSNVYHPTYLNDLVVIIDECISHKLNGVINIGPNKGINKINWAYLYIKELKLNKVEITDLGLHPLRPENSKMNTEDLYKNNLTIPRSIEDGIKTIKARLEKQ